eukprot:1165858-Prorocentrum_minimum.AAC.3
MDPKTFTLQNLFAMNLANYAELIAEITNSAVKELTIESELRKLTECSLAATSISPVESNLLFGTTAGVEGPAVRPVQVHEGHGGPRVRAQIGGGGDAAARGHGSQPAEHDGVAVRQALPRGRAALGEEALPHRRDHRGVDAGAAQVDVPGVDFRRVGRHPAPAAGGGETLRRHRQDLEGHHGGDGEEPQHPGGVQRGRPAGHAAQLERPAGAVPEEPDGLLGHQALLLPALLLHLGRRAAVHPRHQRRHLRAGAHAEAV